MPINSPLSTVQITIRIAIIVSIIEFFIMISLGIFEFQLNAYTEAIIDIITLASLSTPLIFILVIKPFVRARNAAYNQLQHLAETDPLTHLLNRRYIHFHLKKIMAGIARRKSHGAVLLLDLDNFKAINDQYGHDAGDKVLVETAQRLLLRVREEDVVGRLGGDEFVIIINELNPNKNKAYDLTLQITQQLQNLLSKDIIYNDLQLNISISIGVRLIEPDAEKMEKIIKEADIAMYQAKSAGKGRTEIFN